MLLARYHMINGTIVKVNMRMYHRKALENGQLFQLLTRACLSLSLVS